ncbi:hypothetical protein [Virgisporangium aurantiacum]|uniref:DUF4351 domain-containing protein n=1 Tax=Virgisporangium aurantiacum TaxID=175570 RepID=A0A8J3ZCL8_9ACTN|nr:hypothetical protein [Virgisporangium aurantiacum]GIJ58778.1 hypothetical protein Vau01_062940 [Virgisporangium aurantiacum]
MPVSFEHEALIDLIRQRPESVADLLRRQFDVKVPDFRRAVLLPADLTNVMPTEYRADAVIAFEDPDPDVEEPVYAVVVEVQLRPLARKKYVWPVYVATVHARLECPVSILVICPDLAVAKWAAIPISTGEPGLLLELVALGPDQVPVVATEDDVVDCRELAVLSALAHGGEHPGLVLPVLVASLERFNPEDAQVYLQLVAQALPVAARNLLEEMMGTVQVSDIEFAKTVLPRTYARLMAEGQAEGEIQAILAVLKARNVEVPEFLRTRISTCTDLEQLEIWIARAATATTIDELFA